MKKSGNYISYEKRDRTDEKVKAHLHGMGERIEASEELKKRIDVQIREWDRKTETKMKKEERTMGRFNMKKVAAGVAAACLLVGTVCIAGSGIKSITSSSSSTKIPDYKEFADLPKAEAEAGFEADVVEKFSNGFALTGIRIGEITVRNEAGQETGKEKDIRLDYVKGGDSINLHVRKLFPGESEEERFDGGRYGRKAQAGDVTIYYSTFTQKSVPVDYELTEEDKAGMESGTLNVGYGTSEIEIDQFSCAGWVKDGKLYEISGFNLPVDADGLLGMAQEVVESKN